VLFWWFMWILIESTCIKITSISFFSLNAAQMKSLLGDNSYKVNASSFIIELICVYSSEFIFRKNTQTVIRKLQYCITNITKRQIGSLPVQISDLQLKWRLLSFERIFKTRGRKRRFPLIFFPNIPSLPPPKKNSISKDQRNNNLNT